MSARVLFPAAAVVIVAAAVALVAIRESRDAGVVAEPPPPPECEPGGRDRNPADEPARPRRGEPLIARQAGHIPFGFNDAAVQVGQLGLDEALELYRASGATIWRLVIDWGAVERSPGELDFSRYDELYCGMLAADVRPLWSVTGIPAWAAPLGLCGDPCVRPPEDEHLPQLRRFAEIAASRYPRSVAFEAWNEPNLASYWGGSSPDASGYAKVLEAIYDGVKDGDPEMPVLGGALSNNPTDEPGGNVSLRTFLAEMLDRDALDHMDGLGLHAYPIAAIGEPGDQFTAALDVARELLPRGVRIWITEIGAPTAGGAFAPEVTPDRQAAMMAEAYRRLDASADVDAVLFHTLVDPNAAIPGGTGFGFFERPGDDGSAAPKPVVCAVRTLARPDEPCPAAAGG